MRAALDGAGLTLRHGWKPGVVGEVVRLRAALDWLGAAEEGRVLTADPLGRHAKDRSA